MSNEGKKVKVHYTGTLDDGTKFDSSYDRNQPLSFTCMAGKMIAGFDAAVRDMEVGETVTVHLEPADAYGEIDPERIMKFPADKLGGAERLNIGDRIMLSNSMGMQMPVTVVEKDAETVTLDANHELAGKALNFEITLLEVK